MRRLVLALLLLATSVLTLLLLVAPVEALDIADFGGFPDGSDTSLALTRAVTQALAGPDKTIQFWAGHYAFLTPPPVLPGFIRLVGQGKSSTVLMRQYQGGEFFVGYGNGLGFKALTLWAAVGTSGGYALHLIASNTLGPGGNHEIEDVWITGRGTWAIPLFLDGAGRTVAPIGIRAVTLRNVDVFNGTVYGAEWWNCVACEWFGGGLYQGFGTNEILVVGGSLGQKNRIDADIDWAASSVTGLRAR